MARQGAIREYLKARGQWISLARVHLSLTGLWALAVIPTVIWWHDSILWVAFISVYANVATHWGAYQASRAEQAVTSGDAEAVSDPDPA